ncbi:hypothetical protein YTPLAS18_29790 [Nitrospira sp.]|nr:hypothetical protein YTPLAS18_29790 [Nitrospira sp.]
MAMFSAWNGMQAMQSLMSIVFIMSVATVLGLLVTQTVVRLWREDPAPLLPLPIVPRESDPLLKKAA